VRLLLRTFVGAGLIVPALVLARPVSYSGGWTLMLMNDGTKNTVHAHYSPTAKTSLGYRFEYWQNRELRLDLLQVNRLLKRWNRPDSQANLYLKSGVGIAHGNEFDDKARMAGFASLAADWENRRYFVAYENRYTWMKDGDDFFSQSARIGWAPYEGDYGDLHTWLMLQVDHLADNRMVITPLVRFFKGVHLLETGLSDRGAVLLNYIFRY